MYKPLQVRMLSVKGMNESMRAMRLPKGGEGDTIYNMLGESDAILAGRLIKAGPDHAKAMRGIDAYLIMEMQVGFMIEFETYRHGVECLSTSSAMHGELKNLNGYELAEQKQRDIGKKVYTRIVKISYQALRSMYRARKNHRHPDWRIFCDFVGKLPWFDKLIMP